MKIIIAGGSGFLGSELLNHFLAKKDDVIILTRGKSKKDGNVSFVHWDAATEGEWISCMESVDVLINLTGKSINCRHTASNKLEIINSRVNATKVLNSVIEKLQNKPKLWINASGASIYGQNHHKLYTEDDVVLGDDFSAKVAQLWEKAFFQEEIEGVRKVALRISLVLSNNGGVYPIFRKLTKFGLGGTLGNGNQTFGWIHILDLKRVIDFIIENENLVGPINCVSIHSPNNKLFMKTLRDSLRIPFGIPQPKFLLKLGGFLIGTEGELIYSSLNAYPKRLIDNGFKFEFENCQDALNDLSK